jgi:hypothetical protein
LKTLQDFLNKYNRCKTIKIICFTAVIWGCDLKKDRTPVDNETLQTYTLSTLKPQLRNEILTFFDYTDSVNKEEKYSISEKIFLVHFYSIENECYVDFNTHLYYFSEGINGHIIEDGKLIAFYILDESCSKSLIDSQRLSKSTIIGFYDENSEDAQVPYNPLKKSYRIINGDSLISNQN